MSARPVLWSASTGRVVGVYVTASVAALQVVDVLSNRLELSGRFFLSTLIAAVLGLPLAVGFALLRGISAEGSLSAESAAARRVRAARRRRPRAALATAAGVLGLALALSAVVAVRTGGAAPTSSAPQRVRIIVAEFGSRTGDTLLAAALTDAVRADLEERPDIELLATAGVWEPLVPAAAAGEAQVALAREIAAREGVAGVLVGSVDRFGGAFVVVARLLRARDGAVLGASRLPARDSAALLAALDAVSERSRAWSGKLLPESGDDARRGTRHMGALRAYSDGVRALRISRDTARGLAALDRAVALDPGFALAHRQRGLALYCAGSRDAAARAFTAAYSSRSRLTPREWYHTLAEYNLVVRNDPPRAAAVYRMLQDRFPHTETRRHGEPSRSPCLRVSV